MFRAAALLTILWLSPAWSANSIIPGVSNTPSGPGAFTTQIEIANPGLQPANLTFTFIPADGQTAVPAATRQLAPSTTLTLNDALNSLWNLTSRSGAVVVNYDQFVVITANKSAPLPAGGSIGTALPVLPEETMLESFDIGELVWISQTGAYNTSLAFYLGAPNTQALLTLYDDSGNQVAQTTLSGGPRYVSLPVSTLVTSDLPVASASVYVQSGRLTAYSEIADTASGDLMAARIAGPNDTGGILTLDGALRQTAPDGALLETDLRILNLSAAPASVTVVLGNSYAQISIAPGAIVEVPDVLGNSLNVAGSGGGTLLLSSDATLAAAGRLMRPSNNGGTLSTVKVASTIPPGVDNGQTAIIQGLRSSQQAASTLISQGPVTGSGGAGLSLQDSTGAVLSAIPNALQLGPAVSEIDPLPSILNLSSIPNGASLLATGNGLGLSMAPVSIDQISGDPTYLKLDAVKPYICSPPSFAGASASPASLDQPGNVAITWSATLADSVDLSTGDVGQPSIGSISTAVAATTPITLTSHNSCGDTTTSVKVFVGPPQALSIANYSNPGVADAASGMPGELVTVQLGNLADPTTATAVLFTAPDGQTIGADAVDSTHDGRVLVRVPFWPATASPGYRTGSFTLSAIVAGASVGSLPFTINPLSYSGDPLAGFGALLDRLSGDGSTVIAAVSGISGYKNTAAAQTQAASGIEATLRQMLSSVAASGQATIPADFSGAATITVAASDLATFVAYAANLVIPYPVAPPNSSGTTANCLRSQRPLVGACTTLESARNLELLNALLLSVINPNDLENLPSSAQLPAFLQTEFVTTPAGAVARLLLAWYRYLDYSCLVSPVRLDSFSGSPSTLTSRPDRGSSQLNVMANLAPYAGPFGIAGEFESQALQAILDQYCVNCARDSRPQIGGLLQIALDNGNVGFNQQIAMLADTFDTTPTGADSVVVGACDLQNFYPLSNGPLNDPQLSLYGHTALFAPDLSASGYGDPSYYYFPLGSGTEPMCIVPYSQNFVEPLKFDRTSSSAFSPCSSSPQSAAPSLRPRDLEPTGIFISYIRGSANTPGFDHILRSVSANAFLSGTPVNGSPKILNTHDCTPEQAYKSDGVTASNFDCSEDGVDYKSETISLRLRASSVLVLKTLPGTGDPPLQEQFPHLADGFFSMDFYRTPRPKVYGEIDITMTTAPGCPFYSYSFSGGDETGNVFSDSNQNTDPKPFVIQKGTVAHVSVSVQAHGGNTAFCDTQVDVMMTDQNPVITQAPPGNGPGPPAAPTVNWGGLQTARKAK